jgi:glycosyltransferase involved in cell wall biosynthesis
MPTRNILFISYDGMTDPLGQSQVIPYLCGLSKFGYRFTILSCDKPGRYKAQHREVTEQLAAFGIKWVSIPYHKKPAVLSSWYDYRMLRKTALRLHREHSFDLVHTRVGVPALVGHWLKRNAGIRFLNDIRGFWADERVDGGMWNLDKPLYKWVYRFFRRKEDEFIIDADHNTCLTYAAREEIHSWSGIPDQPIPIDVIPCCADTQLFDPSAINAASKQACKDALGIRQGDMVISYLGSIGGWYLTGEMMRFCKLVADKIPSAKFLFISPHLHEVIRSSARDHGISGERLLVRQAARQEIPTLLSLSDYSVFFIKPCYSKKSSSPTKHAEIMSMGIPVITNQGVGDVKEIVEKYAAGYVVNDFTDQSFQQVIDKIVAGNPFDRSSIRRGAQEYYSLVNAVDRYHQVYEKIFNRSIHRFPVQRLHGKKRHVNL